MCSGAAIAGGDAEPSLTGAAAVGAVGLPVPHPLMPTIPVARVSRTAEWHAQEAVVCKGKLDRSNAELLTMPTLSLERNLPVVPNELSRRKPTASA